MIYQDIISIAMDYADKTNDSEVAARMDSFLRIIEARVNRRLQVQKMSVRAYILTTENDEYYSLPDDFNGLRDIELKDSLSSANRTTLEYVSPEQMNNASTNR